MARGHLIVFAGRSGAPTEIRCVGWKPCRHRSPLRRARANAHPRTARRLASGQTLAGRLARRWRRGPLLKPPGWPTPDLGPPHRSDHAEMRRFSLTAMRHPAGSPDDATRVTQISRFFRSRPQRRSGNRLRSPPANRSEQRLEHSPPRNRRPGEGPTGQLAAEALRRRTDR